MHIPPFGQSAFVAHVCRAPVGQVAMHWLTFVVLGVAADGR